jgi:hydrogenase maturation protease
VTGGDPTAAGAAGAVSKPLVIGIGNRFRRDDGVAGAVLDALDPRAGVVGPAGTDETDAAGFDVSELDGEPTRVVDAWAQRRLVVVVDALLDPARRPGEVVTMQADHATAVAGWTTAVSGHSAGLAEAMRLGEVLDRMPAELVVVGVVGADFGEGPGLSAEVAGAVEVAASAVREAVAGQPAGSGGHGVPG